MTERRRTAIAQLNTYLEGGEDTQLAQGNYDTTQYRSAPVSESTPTTDPLDPLGSVGWDNVAPRPPGVSDRDIVKAAEANANAPYKEKLAAAKEALRQQQLEEKRKRDEESAAEQTTRETLQLIRGIGSMFHSGFSRARSRLEGIPTWGDIWVPLALLLLFFFVLFPVNGHTRLMWLFMTVTRNASIGGAIPQPTLNAVAPTVLPAALASGVNQQLQVFTRPAVVTQPTPGHGPVASGSAATNGHVKSTYAQMMQSTLHGN